MNQKISVITVCYNAAKTIQATIASIAVQTYKDIEYIVVDGKSTDSTLEILKANRSNIDKFVSEPDEGVYDAMNKGLKLASGDWLLFLGADDVLFNSKTIENVEGHLRGNHHLVYGNVIKMPQNEIYDGAFNLYKMIFKNICHQAIFFNRSIFKIKGTYQAAYKINADWEFNLKCFQDSKIKKKYIPQTISYFNAEGLSSNVHDEVFELRKKQLIKSMPMWVKALYKYRRTVLAKRIAKLFLNFDYA